VAVTLKRSEFCEAMINAWTIKALQLVDDPEAFKEANEVLERWKEMLKDALSSERALEQIGAKS
jgi:hypothetical protein